MQTLRLTSLLNAPFIPVLLPLLPSSASGLQVISSAPPLSSSSPALLPGQPAAAPSAASSPGPSSTGPTWLLLLASALAAALVFSDRRSLNGPFLYDDYGTIQENRVIRTETPIRQLFERDYWGQDNLTSPSSHKSFRPVT